MQNFSRIHLFPQDPSPVKKPAPAPETKTVPPKATPKEPAKVKKEQGPLKKETIPAASNGKPTASQISSSPSKIRVKKEYGLPGQTRDTPDEVGRGGWEGWGV